MVKSGQAAFTAPVERREAVPWSLDEVRVEAHEWGVAGQLAVLVFLAPFVGGGAVALSRVDYSLFDFLTREDSVLEWSQFAGYALASLIGFAIAWRFRRLGEKWLGRGYLAFALGNFFVAGEEISWGQRIFGWGTPRSLDNKQRETTVHNVAHILVLFNLAFWTIGLVGFALPWLVRRRAPERTPAWLRAVAPPLFLSSAFLWMFGYKSVRFLGLRHSGFFSDRYGEWAEFCLALSFAAFAVLVLTRRVTTYAVAGGASAEAGPAVPRPRSTLLGGRRRALVGGGIVLVVALAVAFVLVRHHHRQVGTLPSSSAYTQLRVGMSRATVRDRIGRTNRKCWPVGGTAELCLRNGTLVGKHGSGGVGFSRVRAGMAAPQVWALVAKPATTCWIYGRAGRVDRLCFTHDRLVSKARAASGKD